MSERWRNLSDRDLTALYLTAAARNVQWMLQTTALDRHELSITGWALTLSGQPGDARFLINGRVFDEILYPQPSPDLEEIFWNVPAANYARFACRTRIERESAFKNGFACLEFQDGCTSDEVRRRAWYLPDPENDLTIPEESRIRRVIGVGDRTSYILGGASTYKRFENYLEQRFSKTFDDYENILDWACGCGRITRNFRWATKTNITGVDIDGDNITWCREHLPFGQFQQTAVLPPLPFPDRSFDLILAISILGQLREDLQFLWLEELKRVAKRGALLLVAIPGLTQIGLARPHPDLMRKIEEDGFFVAGRNPDLDEVLPGQAHYVSGIHSRDYIHRHYGRYFAIVDIIDAIAANDDLVVMKNDKSGH
jgi:hypothetical protein